jgi:thiosulfate/3-mercaptopyruvate sulfurtransferase
LDPVAGHIPGAVNLPWAAHTDLNTFRSRADELLAGVRPDHTIVSCGSGVTACHTLLQLDRLGRELPALYVGSWSAWCRQDRPVG